MYQIILVIFRVTPELSCVPPVSCSPPFLNIVSRNKTNACKNLKDCLNLRQTKFPQRKIGWSLFHSQIAYNLLIFLAYLKHRSDVNKYSLIPASVSLSNKFNKWNLTRTQWKQWILYSLWSLITNQLFCVTNMLVRHPHCVLKLYWPLER